jgi:hypothetical protein
MRNFLIAAVFVVASGAAHADGPPLPAYDADGRCTKALNTSRVTTGFSGSTTYIPTPTGDEEGKAINEHNSDAGNCINQRPTPGKPIPICPKGMYFSSSKKACVAQ